MKDTKLSHLQLVIGERIPLNPAAAVEAPRDERAIARLHAALLSARHLRGIAEDVFTRLDTLRPAPVPGRKAFSDPSVLERWRRGDAPIPELLRGEHQAWLEAASARTAAVEECKRRLRVTTWAEVTMRAVDSEYAVHFTEFHRRYWGLTEVSDDMAAREKQIAEAIYRWTAR